MPSTCCCVPKCHNRGGHRFPLDHLRKEQWMRAIRRIDEISMKSWTPSDSAVVCKTHFLPKDFIGQTKDGRFPLQQKLKETAIPSQFQWTKAKTPSQVDRVVRMNDRLGRKRKAEKKLFDELETELQLPLDCQEECVEPEEQEIYTAVPLLPRLNEVSTRKINKPMFDVDNFFNNSKAIPFYTGLKHFSKFIFVLNTLGPAAYCLKYIYHNVVTINVKNQFFMTLIELRRHCTNYELSLLFGISEASVKNIV